MSSFNKVIFMGNLTRDPEVRVTSNGTHVANFGLAMNRQFKDSDGNWQSEPVFVDVTMFGKRGETFVKYHNKGSQAFIEGSLRLDSWEDSEGNKRSKLYVVAENWEFVGSGNNSEGSTENTEEPQRVF
jgi:single-strand DNA-binding protein